MSPAMRQLVELVARAAYEQLRQTRPPASEQTPERDAA